MLFAGLFAFGDDYHNLPVIGIVNGYQVVDVQQIISTAKYQSTKAKNETRYVISKTPAVMPTRVSGWTAAPTTFHTGQSPVPGTKMFSFMTPASACFATYAFYYLSNRWNAAYIGVSRENHACSLYLSPGSKIYSSVGEIAKGWAYGWPTSAPTIQAAIDVSGKFVCAVAVNKPQSSPADTNTPALPPATNTWRSITIRFNGDYEIVP